MNAPEYAVPTVLRGAMFVPRQAAGRREPARVTSGAFIAAGLPVPEHPAQRNVYQLTRRRGLPWTPGLDGHIRRRGGELLPRGELILVDIDTPAAVDGTPVADALRWLSDRAVEAGGLLDLSATVSVRTGPLMRCHAVELRTRGTCPGSPGYVVWSEPDQMAVIPRWIADLAGPPPMPVTSTGTGHGGAGTQARLHGIIGRLLAAQRGERNRLLFWASLRVGELAADGDLDAGTAGQALTDAAAELGLVREDGERAVAATIRSGFERVGAAYEPAR